jgi:hypothetical protein
MTPRAEPRSTIGELRRIAKLDVIGEDVRGIESCPRCEGILRWGEDSRYEDIVSCVYCGWRPQAKIEEEL